MATTSQQVYDFSGLRRAHLRTPGNALFSLSYKQGWGGSHHLLKIPFPPATKGVFYYHLSPGSPPQAGELRFKKCDSALQFHKGEDLQVDLGQPWSLPLLNIVQCPSREGFLDELLVEPGLVDQELVADLQNIFRVSRAENRGVGFSRGGLILHDIDQPFVTEVHMPCIAARLVTRQSVQMMKNTYMFWPEAGHAKLSTSPPPFSGIFGSPYLIELVEF